MQQTLRVHDPRSTINVANRMLKNSQFWSDFDTALNEASSILASYVQIPEDSPMKIYGRTKSLGS